MNFSCIHMNLIKFMLLEYLAYNCICINDVFVWPLKDSLKGGGSAEIVCVVTQKVCI